MSAKVQTYRPADVLVTYGGVPITGFDDGTFIKVTPAANNFTKKVGADGEVARVGNADQTDTVEMTLLQTSASNDTLNTFMLADMATGAGALPLQIKDKSGRSLHVWASAWIQKPAEVSYAKEVGNRVWTFDTSNRVVGLIGGNN
jgi:hypothetical protein